MAARSSPTTTRAPASPPRRCRTCASCSGRESRGVRSRAPAESASATARAGAMSLPAGEYGFGAGLRLPVAHKRVRVQGGGHHRDAGRSCRRCGRCAPRSSSTVRRRRSRGTVGPITGCSSSVVQASGSRSSTRSRSTSTCAVSSPGRCRTGGTGRARGAGCRARSYALATLKPGKHFDLFSDTRSQVYGGIAYETPRTNIAVERTANKVLMWNGRVATTFFFYTA